MSRVDRAPIWTTGSRRGLPIALTQVSDAERVGVEHEYGVWRGEVQQDFRLLLPEVAGSLRSLDPGDPRARRLPSGCALTADGREAEIATPPLPVAGTVAHRLDGLLAAERTALAAELEALGVDRLTGFSTHVNVSVPDERVVEVARLFTRHCALAAVVAAEPRDSAGLLVRPRRARLEIGGEYAEGADLVALITFVVSAVGGLMGGSTPPLGPEPVVVASREKFGWHLPPEGPYRALLDLGPAATWTVDETRNTAREVFARTWAWARPHCLSRGLDPEPCDRLAAGGPWRVESTAPTSTCTLGADHSGPSSPSAYDTGGRRVAGGVDAETTWLTWQHVVWGFFRGSHALHAVVPVAQESDFLARLDRGELDAVIERELAPRRRRRRLMVNAQITGAAWWDEVRPGALVPAERDPAGAVPRVSYRRARRAHRHAQAREKPDIEV